MIDTDIDEYIEMWNDNLLVGDGVQHLMNTLIRKRKLDKIQFKRLREALQEMLNDFETKKTDMWTMRNRIETILKGDD